MVYIHLMRMLMIQLTFRTWKPSTFKFSVLVSGALTINPRYQISFEEGFDAIVVIDGLPIADLSCKEKLLQVLNKHLKKCGASKPDSLFMPWDDGKNQSKGCMFL